MPVISMFYGIIIRMYLLDNKHHGIPHIHAKYAEHEASVSIADGEVLAGQASSEAAQAGAGVD